MVQSVPAHLLNAQDFNGSYAAKFDVKRFPEEELSLCAGQPLPDNRIAAEIGVFFTGGFETTGHTIAWAL